MEKMAGDLLLGSKANFSCHSYEQLGVVQLTGDLLLGLKIIKPDICSTSFIHFLYDKLGEGLWVLMLWFIV